MRVIVWRVIAALAIVMVLSPSILTAQRSENRLSGRGRELLAQSRAEGKETVTLLVAADPRAARAVAAALEGLGGTIRFRDDQLGYIRVVIATSQVEAAAALNGVDAIDLDELILLDDPRPEAEDALQVDPPGAVTPGENAYMPTRDIGAPQFVDANPTYDGRGVKIGIVDSGVDVLTPELQTAKLITGALVPKIVDWVTFTDPLTDKDPTWINMAQQVSGAVFTVEGASYTAPALGAYRFGVFNERDPQLGGELANDVNRDGNPAGSSGVFAVLWNTGSNTVWVDANQNRNFADDPPMRDFKIARDIGQFGTDNPATPIRESVPFVVQTDGKQKFVNIGIVSGAHGTHVAGIAAGKNFFGGEFDGVAPEAQIVSVRACLFVAGCTTHALLEGMIYVAKQANVDVINMSIGGLPALNDGNNARAVLYDRLIDQSKVQIFLSAGNSGPGLNTIGDPAVASKAMGIGAYVHKDTWLANYGNVAVKEDGLFVFSSRGPAEHGGFKPNIVAPGAAVSTVPAWQPGQPIAAYALPPGYGMFNGTSMAAPQAAGAAALLVSAAKQAGAQYRPEQLRQALISSARFLPAYGAHEQGNGLLQVGAAWDLLQRNLKTVQIFSQAEVKTIISGLLATPEAGPGIYQREGWQAGQSRQMAITLVRTSGGATGTFGMSLGGNDGTFHLDATTVSLPLNTPVQVPITVAPLTAGVHSAILNLHDTATGTIAYQALNTVVAAEQLVASNNFSVTRAGSADRPDKATFFFNVTPAAGAFNVNVSGINGRVRMLRFHPYGLPFDNTNTTAYQTGGTISRTTANPTPGVWEVTVDTSRTSPTEVATFDVTGSILGAVVNPNPDNIPSASLGLPVGRSYTITNRAAAFTGRAVGTALGSARVGPFTIGSGAAPQEYTVDVTAGSTSLRATIGSPGDLGADLDLYVYNCTSGTCVLAGQNSDGDSEESVTINNPAAGKWRVDVVAYAVPAGTTTYNYVDIFANTAFGSIAVTDADALRPANASWTVPGTVTANAAPAAGRVLFGNVQVRTAGTPGVVIGSGDVVVHVQQ